MNMLDADAAMMLLSPQQRYSKTLPRGALRGGAPCGGGDQDGAIQQILIEY